MLARNYKAREAITDYHTTTYGLHKLCLLYGSYFGGLSKIDDGLTLFGLRFFGTGGGRPFACRSGGGGGGEFGLVKLGGGPRPGSGNMDGASLPDTEIGRAHV